MAARYVRGGVNIESAAAYSKVQARREDPLGEMALLAMPTMMAAEDCSESAPCGACETCKGKARLYVAAWILRAAKRRHSGNTGNARLKMQDDMAELLLMLGLAVEPNAPETAGGRRLRPDRWRFARTERRVAMRALGWRSRLGAGRRSPGPRSGGE